MQSYHQNAKTNIHIRRQIQNNRELSIDELAQKHGVSGQTVSKWKNRDFEQDGPSAPKTVHYALSETERILAAGIRSSTWLSLDEIWEMLLDKNPSVSRSSVHRVFQREGINKVPKEKREKAKKFKEYDPGYLHIDVTYLPKFNKKPCYLFVAIDRATRALFYWVYDKKSAESTTDFMDRALGFFPFEITHILTDNGLEFTNRLIKSKKGQLCQKPSKMDIKCEEKNIEHRLTKPSTPKTNGMVERVNRTIKNNTILRKDFSSRSDMEKDLAGFLCSYNLYRRHGSLRKELRVKTPIQAVRKWYELKPEIFNTHPDIFEKKIINLQSSLNQLHQQPCET